MTNDNDLIRRAALQDAGYDTVAVAASQPANPVINADSRQRVTVKPLVWEEQDGKSYRQANCVLGQYQVRFLCEFECWQLSRFVRSGQVWKETFSRHSNKDAAKAAAQADYEARILAALEPHPDPRDEVIAEAEARGMQRAAEICKSAWIQTPEPLTARDCYDAILAAIDVQPDPRDAQIAALVEALKWAYNTLWEVNLNNYSHDDVCRLNDASVEVILGIAPLIGETH